MQTGYFAVFYIQKCLFLSFSRLNSPLCALRKINKPTIFALKKTWRYNFKQPLRNCLNF